MILLNYGEIIMKNNKKSVRIIFSLLLSIVLSSSVFSGCSNESELNVLSDVRDSLVMSLNSEVRLSTNDKINFNSDSTILSIENNTIKALNVGNTTVLAKYGSSKKEIQVEVKGKISVNPYSVNYTFYDETANTYGITWNTDSKGCPVVQYHKSGETFDNCRTVNVYEEYNMDEQNYICKTILDKLEYDSVYYYRVGDLSGVWSAVGEIKTKNSQVNNFSFTIVTDTQNVDNDYSYFSNTLKTAFRDNPDNKFILHCGDFVEYSKKDFWSKMFEENNQYFINYPIVPVGGNHDVLEGFTDGKLYPFTKYFNIKKVNEQDCFRGQYYYFTYGDVLFVVLDCYETNKAMSEKQQMWLESVLQKNNKKWTIISAHCPVFSPAEMALSPQYRTPTLNLRKQLFALSEKYKIDLVLSGDDHVYSRTFPINHNKEIVDKNKLEECIIDGITVPVYKNIDGTIYQVCGVTGNKYGKIYEEITEDDLNYLEKYHIANNPTYLNVNVTNKNLVIKLYEVNDSGVSTLIDVYGLQK